MARKLFKITLGLFLVLVSLAAVVTIIMAIRSVLSSSSQSGAYGIVFVTVGFTKRQLDFMVLGGSLFIACLSLLWRRRRFRR